MGAPPPPPEHRRIGYVVKAFPQLSETFIENEIRVLGQRGLRIDVASLHAPEPALAGHTHLPRDRIHVLPGRARLALPLVSWSVRHPLRVLRAAARAVRCRSWTMLRGIVQGTWIASTFRRVGVRQLHAHFATDAASAAMVAAELLQVPWSFTIHARELYLRTSGLWDKCRSADAVVTVCEYNVGELERACGGRLPERLHIVRCGVDLDDFPARTAPPARDGFHLVSVGRLVPKKGFEDLIDAVGLLRGDGLDVSLDIVGAGPLEDRLRDRVEERGLRDSVRLLGPCSPSGVAQHLRSADVFVLANVVAPDGDRDSMPVVTKEAMATAVPVVTTDVVANPEMVDAQVGRLVPPHDPRALAAAIAELAALTSDERHLLGAAGRCRAQQQFSLEVETAKLHAIFDALV